MDSIFAAQNFKTFPSSSLILIATNINNVLKANQLLTFCSAKRSRLSPPFCLRGGGDRTRSKTETAQIPYSLEQHMPLWVK